MAYRLAGQSTELCSCNAPCPCAAGQSSAGAWCEGILVLDIHDGELNGVSLAGTKAIVAVGCAGLWTGGSFPGATGPRCRRQCAAAGGADRHPDRQTRRGRGHLGRRDRRLEGGVHGTDRDRSPRRPDHRTGGRLGRRRGGALPDLDETMPAHVANAHSLHAKLTAGKSTKSRVRVPGLEFDHDGSGMWVGPFEMTG